jgi:hypothetical protein
MVATYYKSKENLIALLQWTQRPQIWIPLHLQIHQNPANFYL